MKNKVILVGGFHEIIELCEAANIEVIGIIDDALQDEYMGYRVFGKDSEAAKVFGGYPEIPIAITPDSPAVRKRLSIYYSEIGFKFISLIHPDAAISKHSRIGHGTVIQRGAHISSNTTVGNFVKVNTCANITHDVQIGDFATIAPNAVILSRSIVAESCYIGANSTIMQNRTIHARAVVGAGAVVTRDVLEGETVVGNPARGK